SKLRRGPFPSFPFPFPSFPFPSPGACTCMHAHAQAACEWGKLTLEEGIVRIQVAALVEQAGSLLLGNRGQAISLPYNPRAALRLDHADSHDDRGRVGVAWRSSVRVRAHS